MWTSARPVVSAAGIALHALEAAVPMLARAFRRPVLLLTALVVAAAPSVVTAPSATAAPASAAAAADRTAAAQLTVAQGRTVLRLIDAICGDTWCEGDFLFDFRSFGCEPREPECTLRLRIAPLTTMNPRWYVRSGEVHGFTRFDQMVATAANGYQSLNWDFYLAVSRLITRVEASVPR